MKNAEGNTATTQPLLTVKEVATLLNVSVRTIETEIATSRLTPLRIRGARRFRQADIDAYIASCAA